MELTYTKVGDYYIPDLTLDDDPEHEVGVYGRMHERFLKEHRPGHLHKPDSLRKAVEASLRY